MNMDKIDTAYKWVPVSEGLPEIDQFVLWRFESGYILHGVMNKGMLLDEFLGGDDVSGKITHWMPEPEPPEEC